MTAKMTPIAIPALAPLDKPGLLDVGGVSSEEVPEAAEPSVRDVKEKPVALGSAVAPLVTDCSADESADESADALAAEAGVEARGRAAADLLPHETATHWNWADTSFPLALIHSALHWLHWNEGSDWA